MSGQLAPNRDQKLQTGFLIVGVGVFAVAVALAAFLLWNLEEVRLSTRVSTGMSEADARALLGDPTHVIGPGEPMIPDHVASFPPPDHPVEHRLLVYQRMFSLFIYVFINDSGRVTAVYSYRS